MKVSHIEYIEGHGQAWTHLKISVTLLGQMQTESLLVGYRYSAAQRTAIDCPGIYRQVLLRLLSILVERLTSVLVKHLFRYPLAFEDRTP